MISRRDRDKIAQDVMGIIGEWDSGIIMYNPLPIGQQPGWNPILREITGDVQYSQVSGIPIAIIDTNRTSVTAGDSGDRVTRTYVLRIPSLFSVTEESVFDVPNEDGKFRVTHIDRLEGQWIVTIDSSVGGR